MKNRILYFLLVSLFLGVGNTFGQINYKEFSGRLIDAISKFPIAQAKVYFNDIQDTAIIADDRGDFTVLIPDTLINFVIKHPDYETTFYFINHDNPTNQLLFIYPVGEEQKLQQTKTISFKVIDGKTNQPIPYVNITTVKGEYLELSDAFGNVTLNVDANIDSIVIADVNYKEIIVALSSIKEGQTFTLNEIQNELQTVWVKAKRTKYSNKDNPAVALIKKVVEQKGNNYILDTLTFLKYNKYEKVQMGNYDFPKAFTHNLLTRRQSFIFDNIDTVKYKPHGITPIYIQEKMYDVFVQENKKNKREQLTALKKVQFNDNFIGNKSIDNYLNHIYINFDLTDENVMVMTNQFMSPMAKMAPAFYKYFLGDTIKTEDGKELIELYFGPRNKNDFLFLGRLYINKANYAVEYAKMGLSKDINLNFIKDIKFDVHYKQLENGRYVMIYNNLFADFNILNESTFGLYGEKLTTINNIITDDTTNFQTVFGNPKFGFVDEDSLLKMSKDIWDTLRPIPLTSTEALAYKNMDSLYRQKGFNEKLKWMRLLFMGYLKTGIFEIGPTNTFYAFNPIEGFRLRAGGRTMINETKRYNLEGYGAYGFKDKRWKWYISGAVALYKDKNRLLTEYPFNYLKFTYQNDLLLPGQNPSFVQESSFLLSFKRGVNDKYLFNKYYKLEYYREFANHLRIIPFVQFTEQQPLGSWYYITGDETYDDTVKSTKNTEVGFKLRWAPNERIIQGRTSRTELNTKYPVFTFNTKWALKDILGGNYNYQNYNLGIFKRVLIPQMGFINTRLNANYIVGENIPFTLLNVASGNQTYWLSSNDYMLMNYMEFISDRNIAVNLDYHMYGFIFNKIPFFKRLKFREVIGVKMLYGSIKEENLPIKNPSLFKFPKNEAGAYTTYTFGSKPYVESYIGIENILGFIRVDAIWRNTYLELPNVSKFGVRLGFYFDF